MKISHLLEELAAQIQAAHDDELIANARQSGADRVAVIDKAKLPASLSHGVADFLTARRGVGHTGEAEAVSDEFIEDEPETVHDLLGRVRQTSRVRLVTQDMTNLSVILAWWLFKREWESPKIRFSYRRAAQAHGVSYHGQFAKNLRQSLVRIDAWRAEISESQPDGSEKWHTVGLFSSVQGHDAANREDGEIIVTLHEFIHRYMLDRKFALFPLAVYRGLGSDIAKELYRFIETQRGFGANGDYSLTVTQELLHTLGCHDSQERRVRLKLRRACEEIKNSDPRYVEAELRKSKKGTYVLHFKRQRVIERPSLLPKKSDIETTAARQ